MVVFNVPIMLILNLVLFHLNIIGNAIASPNCRQAEYRVGDECCPACPAGLHVNRHCTEYTTTSCARCTEGTFQDGDSGREQCFSCQNCDAGLGLKVKKSCTSTSDALCEPLDGYFCSASNRGGCLAAQRHTVCSPGRYISQRGTADKDTECLQCTDGTFSDGTSSSCQNHTKCESVRLKQIKPGTDSTDSECGEHGSDRGHVAGIVPGIILVMALMALIIAIIQRNKKRAWISTLKQKQESPKNERSDHQLSDLKKPPEAGEEASDLPSSPLLSPEPAGHPTSSTTSSTPATSSETQPAGQATSSTPATSSETQPAGQATSSTPATSSETQPAETTPLMSSDSPKPTRDLQEHTITTPDATTDDDDDDPSLDPLTGHPEV